MVEGAVRWRIYEMDINAELSRAQQVMLWEGQCPWREDTGAAHEFCLTALPAVAVGSVYCRPHEERLVRANARIPRLSRADQVRRGRKGFPMAEFNLGEYARLDAQGRDEARRTALEVHDTVGRRVADLLLTETVLRLTQTLGRAPDSIEVFIDWAQGVPQVTVLTINAGEEEIWDDLDGAAGVEEPAEELISDAIVVSGSYLLDANNRSTTTLIRLPSLDAGEVAASDDAASAAVTPS